MRRIKMADLQQLHLRMQPELHNAIEQVILEADYIRGKNVSLFEERLGEYIGAKQVVSCANGTDALFLSLKALDLPVKSEVIIPSFNYVSAAEAVCQAGLIPVFADVDAKTFQIDAAQIERYISSSTSAIIAVHLFGQSADMVKILSVAEKYQLKVLEDNAQSLGSSFLFSSGEKMACGTMGTMGTTSFFPSKVLGCMGDGGAVFTQDKELADKVRMLANHGQSQKYRYDLVGINSRLDTIQAAVLNVKLKYLDGCIERRQMAADRYDAGLSGIPGLQTPFRASSSTHVFHQYVIKVPSGARDILRRKLAEKEIPTMVYYPSPLHLQQAYRLYIKPGQPIPVSEKLCGEVMALPIDSEICEEQQAYICKHIRQFLH